MPTYRQGMGSLLDGSADNPNNRRKATPEELAELADIVADDMYVPDSEPVTSDAVGTDDGETAQNEPDVGSDPVQMHDDDSVDVDDRTADIEDADRLEHDDDHETQVPSRSEQKQTIRRLPKGTDRAMSSGRANIVDSRDAKSAILRNVPKPMLMRMRAMFPEATNNTDALVAYVMTHCDADMAVDLKQYLTREQSHLVSSYSSADDVTMRDMLIRLGNKLDNMGQLLSVLELLSGYVAFDRAGFSIDYESNRTPGDVNFLVDGLFSFMMRAEAQSSRFAKDRAKAIGRVHPSQRDQ